MISFTLLIDSFDTVKMLPKMEETLLPVLHVWSIIFLQGNDFDRDVNVRKLLTDTNFRLDHLFPKYESLLSGSKSFFNEPFLNAPFTSEIQTEILYLKKYNMSICTTTK